MNSHEAWRSRLSSHTSEYRLRFNMSKITRKHPLFWHHLKANDCFGCIVTTCVPPEMQWTKTSISNRIRREGKKREVSDVWWSGQSWGRDSLSPLTAAASSTVLPTSWLCPTAFFVLTQKTQLWHKLSVIWHHIQTTRSGCIRPDRSHYSFEWIAMDLTAHAHFDALLWKLT